MADVCRYHSDIVRTALRLTCVLFSSEFKWKCLECGDASLSCLTLSLSAHAVFAIFSVQSTIFAFSLCIKYLLYDMLCLKTFAAHMQCNALISVLHLQCDELEVIATLYFVIATLLYFVGSCQGNAIGFYYLSIIYISLTLFLCNLSFRNVHCGSNYHIIFFKF